MKEVMEKLMETLKCPVCFNPLRPPVSQCVSGHGICSNCRTESNSRRFHNCPVCRGKFLNFKNRLFDEVLDVIPQQCVFNGCGEIIKPRDDHEQWCGFRPTPCIRCDWYGCGQFLLNHFRSDHKDVVMFREKTLNMFWKKMCFAQSRRESSWFVPLAAHGHFFWMKMTIDPNERLFKKTFYYVPNGKKLDSAFMVKLDLKNSGKTYSVTAVLTTESLLNPEENCNSIILHSSVVDNFVHQTSHRLYFDFYMQEINK